MSHSATFPLPAENIARFGLLAVSWSVQVALLLGVAVLWRSQFFGASPFPINDGGLFYAFSRAILENGLSLPAYVAYNGVEVPLAYPPLGFWLAALISRAGIDLLSVYKYLPLLINAVFLYGCLLFYRRMKLEPLALILAGIVLVLSTRSFEYLIMGGGMSRGLGSAFAVFAFVAALDAMETRSWRSRIACGFLVAGAVLSHLEWGISAGLGVSLLFLLRCERKMEALAAVSVVGAISLTLIAPWLWWVATAFGMDPFLAASQTTHRSPVVQLFYLVSLDFIPWYLVAFVVVGAVGHIRARKGFWLLFLLISYFLTPRHHPTLSVIAGSVLAADGILLLAALVPYWRRFIGHEADGAGPAHALTLPGPSHGRAMLLMLMTALWMVGVGITETRILREMRSLDAVSPDEARLLEWIGREIPPGETFVVVTEDLWSVAELGEWLPAVTPHRSLATAQGLEWIDGTRFWQVLYGHRKIRALAERAPASLPLYLARNYPPCAYVIAQEAGEYFFNQDGFTLIGRFGDTWLYRMTGTQAGPCLPGPPPGSM